MPNAYANAAMSTRQTSQRDPILGKDMVENNAGGYVYAVTPLERVRRFLILGSDSNTYYQSAPKLTEENHKVLKELFDAPGGTAVLTMMEEVSHEGLAPRVSPMLFALAVAMASKHSSVRTYAAKHSLPIIVRTNSHMLEFISYVDDMRGWGRLLREAVGDWYNKMPIDKLAYQVAKYRNRSGWTTHDALRMAKPVPENARRSNIYAWVANKPLEMENRHPLLVAIDETVGLNIDDYRVRQYAANFIWTNKLTREMLPTEWLNHKEVWEALLINMPMTAMIRNLGKMTEVSLLKPFGAATSKVCTRLRDPELITKARIHPFQILLALTTYQAGRGVRGSLKWDPVSSIVAALNEAYHLAFKNIVPAGKRTLMAIDISPSMNSNIMNTHLSCMQAAGAFAMATVATEPQVEVVAFASGGGSWGKPGLASMPLTKGESLGSIVRTIARTYLREGFCGTDCALPMMWALEKGLEVDTFIVITDNETWAGEVHPSQALDLYRAKTGIDAKLVVVGMTSTGFTIADPKDKGMMDVVGFDSSAPRIIADFSRGDI